jgi:hypothetical protein
MEIIKNTEKIYPVLPTAPSDELLIVFKRSVRSKKKWRMKK